MNTADQKVKPINQYFSSVMCAPAHIKCVSSVLYLFPRKMPIGFIT